MNNPEQIGLAMQFPRREIVSPAASRLDRKCIAGESVSHLAGRPAISILQRGIGRSNNSKLSQNENVYRSAIEAITPRLTSC